MMNKQLTKGTKIITLPDKTLGIITKITKDWITITYTQNNGNIKKGTKSDYKHEDIKNI